MPSINFSESDFETIASAAVEAYVRGDEKEADDLDRIARKMNAALTNRETRKIVSPFRTNPITWEDVPSTLEFIREGEAKCKTKSSGRMRTRSKKSDDSAFTKT